MTIKQALTAATIWLCISTQSGFAGPYSTVAKVNDGIITQFEVKQRMAMLRAFGTPGDVSAIALDQLIDDRLRQQAGSLAGIRATDDDVLVGMEEFAARGNFNSEQLLGFLRQRGVYRESFEDFVRAGLIWRNVVGAKFASKVTISDSEVDANLDVKSVSFPKTVHIAEIILPIENRGAAQTRVLADRLSETLKSNVQFSTAARKFSKSATAANGGDAGWVELGALPRQVATRINALEVGQVTSPINLGGSIAVYQLRGIRAAKSAGEQVIAMSYAQVAIPPLKNGQAGQVGLAKKIIGDSDTCLDLRANGEKYKAGAFSEASASVANVPNRIGVELAKLDPQEASYYVTGTGGVNVIMLCSRAKDLPEGAREQIRNALFNQRVGSFGNGYLQELRGDAIIVAQ